MKILISVILTLIAIMFILSGFKEGQARIEDCLIESNKYLVEIKLNKRCLIPLVCSYREKKKIVSEIFKTQTLNNSLISNTEAKLNKEGYYISDYPKIKVGGSFADKIEKEEKTKLTVFMINEEGGFADKIEKEEKTKLTVFMINEEGGFAERIEKELSYHNKCNNLRKEKELVNIKLWFNKIYSLEE